ncbi:MAG: VWA domain-containing protein [Gammaproteobacteria bacterium]|nr:VWA domain-containing protein [Gammaproteobacteria bacterium]
MSNTTKKFAASISICILLGLTVTDSAYAESQTQRAAASRQVDVVIALDVSGSMSGLIESAKQRLWDIVNELGRAQPQPELRLAILSYGRPVYGSHTGYVKIDLPFTSDLDAVNETLFAFGTSGGDEYVARVVSTSVNELTWSSDPNALRILFVAGNEAATQDPQISLQQATQAATNAGIVVNTIYCGSDNDRIAAGWRKFATLTNGLYASIDQNSAAVANISTPMDGKLAKLNQELNVTYLAYGAAGKRRRANQLDQDENAGAMSSTAMASRVVTKAGRLYDNSEWDLVDAVNAGTRLEELDVEALPDEMQSMNDKQREVFVSQQAEKREAIQAQISELDKERRAYIEKERSSLAQAEAEGLDEVMQKGLRTLAEEKGFTFD